MGKETGIEKIERLNLVLNAIREVGRLLVSENDRERLIKGICDILIKRRGYFNAWIGLVDEDQQVGLVVDSGFDARFDRMKQRLRLNKFTRCIRAVLETGEVFAVADPVVECTDCILAENYADRGAIAVALVHEQQHYGFMVLSTPKRLAMDDMERNIIKEMADDIAMALYRMELEEKRLLAEADRQRSQARFKTLIENSLNHISIIQNDRIVYRSHGLRKVHRLIDQVFNPPDFPQIYEGDQGRVKEIYHDLMVDRCAHIETEFQYHPVLEENKNGGLRWALLSACKIDYIGEESVLTNIMDITDSKEIQTFLRIQDKMTSLGRVTAGIAHEIRNPLSGIYIYLKALKQIYNHMGDITKVVSIIDKIELASNKIESIIQRVMDFSRPSRPRFVMTDLNQYIDEVTKLSSVTLRRTHIKFVKKLDPKLPRCFAEPHLIEQVILNLVTNAAEAMKDFDGEKRIELSTGMSPDGDSIWIRVIDTGPGIPYALQSKIFDPFYTTKANSSGIGLSICHRIILDHGGTLKLNSSGDRGAQFLIELPLDADKGGNRSMIQYTIAIVDDEESIRDSLDLVLSPIYTIRLYEDAESFLTSLDKGVPDLVLMDIGLPMMNGIDALTLFKADHPDIPVIMITAFEDITMVIQSMKGGAFDFMIKPINPDIMELTIKRAVASIALVKEVQLLQEKYLRENEPCFIGESKNIENVMDFINMVSKSADTPIMILGETGTGKELIAKAIHARSPVFQGPFVAVNCSAFPEDLIESELFGYEPGAFSGARPQGKRGVIEEAHKGTLFLDEVADLSPAGQAKLLRFLESGEFYKVGGTRKQQVHTRVVSATNKNIEDLVDEEKFRRDLYFRLCVVKADIPSLNQRPDDILPLAKHFLHEFNLKFKKELKGFSQEAADLLLAHNFTGNVRELKNIIERSVLVSRTSLISVADLGLGRRLSEVSHRPRACENRPIRIPEGGVHLGDILSGIERQYLALAVEKAGGNESRAAKLVNMNHHTFRYRWKKLKD